jgi:type 2 lantibiotic biosynthesis protein LanM
MDKNLKIDSNIFLEAADAIGSQLCKQVFWLGSRCNWIGRSIEGPSIPGIAVNRALGPEIYDGTSGIALFLSYLYKYTGKEEYRRTAEGAIRQSLSLVESIPTHTYFGFYTGCVGIIYAATKIGVTLNNDEFLEKSLDIVYNNLYTKFQHEHLMDIISGNAGAIPALLHIYFNLLHDEKIYDLALKLGGELLSCAVKEPFGWSWDHRANGITSAKHNLTGFSHGAAGIGYGLLELYNMTEKKDFLEASEKAFSYENHWFSEQNSNWPDFRTNIQSIIYDDDNIINEDTEALRFSKAWCHGAPGIGLSRLRAYQILRREEYMKECKTAIKTTMQLAEQKEGTYNESNYSLCHGLTGICELLICASDVFNEPSYRSLPIEIAIQGINKYLRSGRSWPCGIPEGEPPDLMLGLAGIGYYYLRLYNTNEVPSVLMIKSD